VPGAAAEIKVACGRGGGLQPPSGNGVQPACGGGGPQPTVRGVGVSQLACGALQPACGALQAAFGELASA